MNDLIKKQNRKVAENTFLDGEDNNGEYVLHSQNSFDEKFDEVIRPAHTMSK